MHLGRLGGLVGVINTGEILDLSRAGLLVKAFGVTFFRGLEAAVHEYLDKRHVVGFVEFTHDLAIRQIWADKAAQDDYATVYEQLGHFTYPADVLGAVFSAETQILVDAETNVVAIESVHEHAALIERLLQCHRDSAFARA